MSFQVFTGRLDIAHSKESQLRTGILGIVRLSIAWPLAFNGVSPLYEADILQPKLIVGLYI
jgi:hypothetical protein